jgi:hypothetical protein
VQYRNLSFSSNRALLISLNSAIFSLLTFGYSRFILSSALIIAEATAIRAYDFLFAGITYHGASLVDVLRSFDSLFVHYARKMRPSYQIKLEL